MAIEHMDFPGLVRVVVAAALAGVALLGSAGVAPVVAQTGTAVAGVAPAAARPGHVVGRVVSSETGEPVAGAHVRVAGFSAAGLSNTDGRFMIRDLDRGTHALVVEVIGFQRETVDGVDVAAGAVTRVDVTLRPQAVELGEIRVAGAVARGSRTALMDERQRSAAMTDAIGTEQIARSPDSDAADAIKRVSGVTVQDGRYVFVRGLGERYTTASLNGARIPSPEPERRVVPLDLFPTGLLQTITTSKTFTPDQPGDFSGARIDLRTRDYPAYRQVTVSASMGLHPDITGRRWLAPPMEAADWLALGAAGRQIPAEAETFASASRGPEVNEVVNSFRNVWSVREATAPPSASLGVSVGGRDQVLGRELGYLLSGTYSAGAEAAFEQRRALAGADGTDYNRYEGESGRYGVIWGGLANFGTGIGEHTRLDFNNSYNRSADHEARLEEGTDEDTNARVRVERLQYTERMVRSNQLRATHELGDRHELRWSATSSGVERHEPDRSEFVTWLDPEVPIWFKHEEGAMRSFGALHESNLDGALDYELRLGDRVEPHRLLLGVSHRTTHRDATSQVFRIQPFNWSETDDRWQGEPEEFFDGRHSENGEGNFLLARDRSGGNYTAEDEISAGYVMADVALGSRLRVVGGARLEHSDLKLGYESQVGAAGTARPSYSDVLPSLSLSLDLTASQQLRLSAARTLARPEYREIAPIAYREVLGGEQVIGNSELKRTLIENFDARWEWYPAPGEAVSVGLFAKTFQDPVEQRFLARSGTDTRTFQNAESAVNYGVELEVTRGLGFLGDPFRPLAVFGNVTVMRSEVKTGQEGDEPRAMVGQAPYVVNGGLSWTSEGAEYGAALFYNRVGPRIVNARASGSEVDDVIEMPRPGLDLSLRFPLPNGLDGKLDLKNLLDSPHELRQGETIRQYHRTGRSASLGLTWRP